MTEEERKEMVRVRNAISAKIVREQHRDAEKRIVKIHGSNEERLKRLEETVDVLTLAAMQGRGQSKRGKSGGGQEKDSTREARGSQRSAGHSTSLYRHETPSVSSRTGKESSEDRKDHGSSDKAFPKGARTENRPSWFGDAF